jgi:hypothetical protein
MNDTGNQFYTNKTNQTQENKRTIEIQKSSIKILKQLMQHKRAKDEKN